MGKAELEGYHGEVLRHLEESGAAIGSILRVTSKSGEVFEGVLIPRSESGDKSHISLKLKNGYNIGIHVGRAEKIEVVGKGEKPHFTRPSPTAHKTGLPKVAIISTGGTIASRVDYRTGAVQPALTAEDLTSVVPELASLADIDAHILYSEYSENLTPAHWKGIAEETAKRITARADGVVVSHGTDTMHYTAAALSFALQNLPVPVMIVGSQRSSDRPSSDAASNLTGAVGLAARANRTFPTGSWSRTEGPGSASATQAAGTPSNLSTAWQSPSTILKTGPWKRSTVFRRKIGPAIWT